VRSWLSAPKYGLARSQQQPVPASRTNAIGAEALPDPHIAKQQWFNKQASNTWKERHAQNNHTWKRSGALEVGTTW